MSQKCCVYCGRIISDNISREHIIQNALGGLYESTDICCDSCNNLINKYIDVPFTKIFNPIICRIKDFAKTNNSKSMPSCTGKGMYKNEIYDVVIKNNKVIACPELSRKYKCDISKLNIKILSYNFLIENEPFRNGITKIAFNFALDKGISLNDLKHGVSVRKENGKVDNISFSFPIIPFAALNPMDVYLELNTKLHLYHNLNLFSQENKLWCYVDLFNTFQYYVLLSDSWYDRCDVSETYFQSVQKIDRTIPEIHIRRQKHILIYADAYNVEPCLDTQVMKKRISESILKESQKKDMIDAISQKLGSDYMLNYLRKDISIADIEKYGSSLLLYFDENDKLKESTFRRVTLGETAFECVSYPLLLNHLYASGKFTPQKYIHDKFYRLNSFLMENEKE